MMTNASVISVRPGESRISTTDLPSSLSWFGFGAAGNQRKDKIQRQTVVRNARAPPRRTPRRAAPRREGEAHVPRASLAMGVLVRQRARSRRRPARVPSSERFSSVHSSPLPLASSRVGDRIDDPSSGRVVRLTPPTPPSRPAAAAAPTPRASASRPRCFGRYRAGSSAIGESRATTSPPPPRPTSRRCVLYTGPHTTASAW